MIEILIFTAFNIFQNKQMGKKGEIKECEFKHRRTASQKEGPNKISKKICKMSLLLMGSNRVSKILKAVLLIHSFGARCAIKKLHPIDHTI